MAGIIGATPQNNFFYNKLDMYELALRQKSAPQFLHIVKLLLTLNISTGQEVHHQISEGTHIVCCLRHVIEDICLKQQKLLSQENLEFQLQLQNQIPILVQVINQLTEVVMYRA